MGEEVFPWLKSLPVAPEYHPTLAEFQDPIAYIFKIEEEASKYGICKIVPPISASPKKTVIANLNRSLSARNPNSSPTFTTRQQQIGFCPRKHHRPVQKPVWQSGEVYTVPQFEMKARNFEKNYLKKTSNSKKGLTNLEVETAYWKAQVDKPFSVEYANDMPGSAFDQTVGVHGKKMGKKEIGDGLTTIGESQWNMRGVSRAKGSLLKFMKEEIPGVTSPMVYISMLFSWFAWHVEDHDFHSLNYMHLGSGKTWYGVPKDAAVAFEDVIRNHGYGGEINPIVTFATLGQKTTIISPEVLLKAGVPCCRLVQNAGEFVVTFPRAYHSGFSHGFNVGEAANIATPGWLTVARDAAIRRASFNCAPMVSHSQLLYDLAVSFSSSVPTSMKPEPRSSRLKDKLKVEGESLVKKLFLQDIMQNNQLLHILGKGSSIVVLPEEFIDRRIPIKSVITHDSVSDSDGYDDDVIIDKKPMKKFNSFSSLENNTGKYKNGDLNNDKKADPGIFSCVTCGILCYACVAIIQPTEKAANYLMSADCNGISDLVAVVNEDTDIVGPNKSFSGQMPKRTCNGLFDVPVKSTDQIQTTNNYGKTSSSNQIQTVNNMGKTSSTVDQKVNSSLGLLALAYGDSSDSDDGDHKNENDQTFECRVEFERNESPRGRFENEIEMLPGKTIEKMRMNMGCDEDSCRMHIFCLEHALEVEKRLCSVGGVNMLLVCHQDYSFLNFEAKLVAKELGTDHSWTDLEFRESNKEDKKWIQSALDSEELTHGNHDWAVKLGINLFYSASLSRSPLYSKQMHYNSVIYNAFGHVSPSNNSCPIKPKSSGRQKKNILAGKWCGKVWMSNQAHPLLVERDFDEQDDDDDVSSWVDVKHENYEKRFGIETTRVEVSKNSRKRKNLFRVETKFLKVETSPPPSPPVSGGFRRQPRTNRRKKQVRNETTATFLDEKSVDFEVDSGEESGGCGGGPSTRLRKRIIKRPNKEFGVSNESKPRIKKSNDTKKAKKIPPVFNFIKTSEESEEEGEFGCDIEGCNMSFISRQELMVHKKNICPVKGCGKKFFSHKYLVQHRRVHVDHRPLQCPWKGCKMSFKWAWARTEHIRVHTGARPYVCVEDGCGQTFRFVSDFSRHKRKTGHSVKKQVEER